MISALRNCFCITCCFVTIWLVSCDGPLNQRDYLGRSVSHDELNEIQAIDLNAHSKVDPVTIEQASEELMDTIIDESEPTKSIEVNLADVRASALENNLDLRVEVFEPAIAEQDVDAEAAKFDAVFTATAQRNVTDSPTILGTEGSSVMFDFFEVGVDVPLQTGGTASVSLPATRTDTNNPFSLLNPAFTTDLRFSISQPLLRNASVNVSTHSIRVARRQHQIATARTKLEAIRILANTDRAYWNLYAARGELEVRQKQYELAVQQLEKARRRVDAGDVAPIEVTRAESGLAGSLEAIIVAQTSVRRAQRDLKRIMNRNDLPLNSITEVLLLTEPDPLGLDLDAEDLAEFAVENRMEMLELELQLAIDSSTVDLQKNARLPLVTLDYSYTVNGLGSSYGDAFDQLPDHSFEDWSLGIAAEIPIGNEAAKARFHQAVLRRLQRLASKEQRELAIRQEVYDALDQLEQNWQRILAARQEAILSGRTYEAEQRQFEVGIRTSTDVLEAAADLADAQSREVQALADYQVSLVDIAFATGTLLGKTQVRWDAGEFTIDN